MVADNEDDCSEGSNDPADTLFQRSNFLREMEKADAVARQESNDHEAIAIPCRRLLDGRTVLFYTRDFLADQRYYDDLKHVDYNFIYYEDNNSVLIEQDKSLGKGGLCWDAAFILSEYLSTTVGNDKTAIELGSGTGVCGVLVAAQCPSLQHVHVTDLPNLQPLLQRNVKRLLGNDDYDKTVNSIQTLLGEKNMAERQECCKNVKAFVLDWEDNQGVDTTYDIIFGADVVATLYNPIALVRTIHRLCHESSIVYISFKERLSTIHRQFEHEMQACFASLDIIHPDKISRNHNPNVKILIASNKI